MVAASTVNVVTSALAIATSAIAIVTSAVATSTITIVTSNITVAILDNIYFEVKTEWPISGERMKFFHYKTGST